MSANGQTTAKVWTIRHMMKWMAEDFAKRELSSPRLDAELLVAHALDVTRVRLYMDLDRPLQPNELADIRKLVARRREHEPVAYILGRREFYGRSFRVSPHVLIPRPDTETLVERALQVVDERNLTTLWDVCTGSGAIGLSILAEREAVTCVLSDVSEEALNVARENADSLAVADRARFLCGDLLEAFSGEERVPLVCVNPPYVTSSELRVLSREVRDHEPALALDAGADGLSLYRRMLAVLRERLTDDGVALLECGKGQAGPIAQLAAEHGFNDSRIYNDLGGIGRVVELS